MIGIDIRYLTDDMEKGFISTGVGLFGSELLKAFSELNKNQNYILIISSKKKKLTTYNGTILFSSFFFLGIFSSIPESP